MRQLQEVMRTENGLLRDMRLARLQELQAEKSSLAGSYELELRRLRQAARRGGQPARCQAAAPAGGRTRARSRRRLRANADRLLQIPAPWSRASSGSSAELGATEPTGPRGYRGPSGLAADPAVARVIPMAVDRRC